MNIIILGAGSIGSTLALTLSQEEHNVIVIDKDPKPLEKLGRIADVATRLGSGTDWTLLEELFENAPDLFIALSRDDETNLVACTIAKNLGCPKTVARVRCNSFLDRSRLDFSRLFFVDHFIGTDLIIARDIVKTILHPGTKWIENFAHGAVQMRTLTIPDDWNKGKTKLAELNLGGNLLVGLIKREGKIIFPKGHDTLLPADEATFIGETAMMQTLPKLFGITHKEVRIVAIAGATPITLTVSKLLEKHKVAVKVIDRDEEKCKKLASELPHATILNQEVTDLNFLMAEQIGSVDVFAACTGSTETNILAAALARQVGCEDAVAVISDEGYVPLLETLDIHYTLSEQVNIGNRIHAIILEGSLQSIASLYENQAKILEIKVSSDSEIVGIPLADLSKFLPHDFLIAMIENRGRVMIARGSHILAPGDTVIVISSPKHIEELERIF